MPFPTSESALLDSGYQFQKLGRCKGCGRDIEWWWTPRGKHMPLDPGTLEPHWSTCPQADDFRRGRDGKNTNDKA